MKLRVGALCFLAVFCCAVAAAQASPLEAYQEARRQYLFAAACLAAYNDDVGHVARHALREQGMTVTPYHRIGAKADARLLWIEPAVQPRSGKTYIIAATGTESGKDVRNDVSFTKVSFGGPVPGESDAAAARPPVSGGPAVHWGFYQYMQAWLYGKPADGSAAREMPSLDRLLRREPDSKVYLTGHSLGGAAAELAAAQLLSTGAPAGRIEVVTFGAPAVGNQAFQDQYAGKLNLTRIVVDGDPVVGVLQRLDHSYVQSGRAVRWPLPRVEQNPHQMVVYLDAALRNYYQKRRAAADAGLLERRMSRSGRPGGVYVAPVRSVLPDGFAADFWYMREALWDIYRDNFAAYALDDGAERPLDEVLRAARRAGCDWVVAPEIEMVKERGNRHGYLVILRQSVYRASDGRFIAARDYINHTRALTPVMAVIDNGAHLYGEAAAGESAAGRPRSDDDEN